MIRMKIVLFTLVLTISNSLAFAKTDSYPGLIKLITGEYKVYGSIHGDLSKNKSDTIAFKFFNKPADTHIARHLSFYFDWNIPRRPRIIETDCFNWLVPMSLDTLGGFYGIYFTCKSKQGDWFEIVINEKTQETLWVQGTRHLKFISWKKLDNKRKYDISIKTTSTIYSRPDSLSSIIKYTGTDCFEVLKIKRSWMQVSNKNSERCNNYELPFVEKGWVYFKSTDKIFVQVSIR